LSELARPPRHRSEIGLPVIRRAIVIFLDRAIEDELSLESAVGYRHPDSFPTAPATASFIRSIVSASPASCRPANPVT